MKRGVRRATESPRPLTEIINKNFSSPRYCANMSIKFLNILNSLGQFSKVFTITCELFSSIIFPFYATDFQN